MRIALVLALLVGACSSQTATNNAPTQHTDPNPTPTVSADAEAAPDAQAGNAQAGNAQAGNAQAGNAQAGNAQEAPDAAVEDARVVSAQEHLLYDLGAGATTIDQAVDPARGLVVIRYIERMPDGARAVQDRKRWCGTQLARAAIVRDLLHEAAEQAKTSELTCEANQCHIAGMEWVASFTLVFDTLPNGQNVLVELQQFSEANLSEEFMARATAYITSAETALRRTPCRN